MKPFVTITRLRVAAFISPAGDEDHVVGHVVQRTELLAGAIAPSVASAMYPDQDRQEVGLYNLRDIYIEQEAVLVTLLIEDDEAGVETKLGVDLRTDAVLGPPTFPDAVPAPALEGNWSTKPQVFDRRLCVWNILRQSL